MALTKAGLIASISSWAGFVHFISSKTATHTCPLAWKQVELYHRDMAGFVLDTMPAMLGRVLAMVQFRYSKIPPT